MLCASSVYQYSPGKFDEASGDVATSATGCIHVVCERGRYPRLPGQSRQGAEANVRRSQSPPDFDVFLSACLDVRQKLYLDAAGTE